MDQRPIRMDVFGLLEEALAEIAEGSLHRVERVQPAGKDRKLDHAMNGLR